MNILIPTADYPPIEGGISTVTLQLSRELSNIGHSVTVVAPYFPGQQDFDESEEPDPEIFIAGQPVHGGLLPVFAGDDRGARGRGAFEDFSSDSADRGL